MHEPQFELEPNSSTPPGAHSENTFKNICSTMITMV